MCEILQVHKPNSFSVRESSLRRMLTKNFCSKWRTDPQTGTLPCHNITLSVVHPVAQTSRCSLSAIFFLSLSLFGRVSVKHTTNRSGPLTSSTWRVNSNRACCLSGRLDGWLHGWLLDRLSAHLWLYLTPSYSVFLACASCLTVRLFGGMIQ